MQKQLDHSLGVQATVVKTPELGVTVHRAHTVQAPCLFSPFPAIQDPEPGNGATHGGQAFSL